jgi:hypothetical protein
MRRKTPLCVLELLLQLLRLQRHGILQDSNPGATLCWYNPIHLVAFQGGVVSCGRNRLDPVTTFGSI